MARERERGGDREERDSEFLDKLVHINRVAKVVKGGKRFGFAALVVVGDQKGRVGFGHGKAREVPEAIRKATDSAKRGLIRVPLREGRTLHHDVDGRHGAGKVVLRAAPAGTGIIAGGPMRAVFEILGMQDVVAKSQGIVQPLQHGAGDVRCAEEADQPALGGGAPRQEGERDPGAPSRRRSGGRARLSLREGRAMAKAETKKTVTVVQIKSSRRGARGASGDADRARPQQAQPPVDARGHASGARDDRQGCASHPHRRSGVMGQVKMDQRP